jgi:hypothetical protein
LERAGIVSDRAYGLAPDLAGAARPVIGSAGTRSPGGAESRDGSAGTRSPKGLSLVTTLSEPTAAMTADELLEMPAVQLDALFQDRPAGDIPRGDSRGTIVALPGTRLARPLSRVLGLLFWQGKVFSPETQDLKNKILPFGLHAVRAETYTADSWLDGRPCVVLDYSRSSKVAGWIRDEIREISPGVYLGIVWGVGRVFRGRKLVLRFALTFRR